MSQKTEEKSLTLYDEQPTLSFDVAREMKKGYDIVNDVIEKLLKDTRVEEIKDGKGKIIGQRTHVNPQLLAWIRESRLTKNDIWKLSGGDVQQDAERLALQTKAKIILEIAKVKPEKFEEALENWKKNRDASREDYKHD